MRSERGQVMPFLFLLIPLLTLLAGIIVRYGMALLIHNKIQFHCDQRVLDAAAIAARGLEALGKINPYSRKIIDMRRKIDGMIAATGPELAPSLMVTRHRLQKIQAELALKQTQIIRGTELQATHALSRPLPPYARSKAYPRFLPEKRVLPLERELAYRNETGAPLQFQATSPVDRKIEGRIKVQMERFLEKWPGLKPIENIQIQCAALTEMKSLEDPWTVRLSVPEAKL